MKSEATVLHEQDVADLMVAWRKAMNRLSTLPWTDENADAAKARFDELLAYHHAGEVPETDDPNGRLVTVTSIVCPKCHTTYTRDALNRLSGKCLVCGHKEAAP